jgi:inactivated superfamily I helicase
VQRNREWFSAVIPKFVSIWETIEKERVSGYSHRASVKKSKSGIAKQAITADSSTSCGNTSQFIRNIQTIPAGGICLIKLDEAGNNIAAQNTAIETHNVLLL